ncbi:MAG: hypothetical protein ACRCYY_20360 [Trueperaceae bacterium]
MKQLTMCAVMVLCSLALAQDVDAAEPSPKETLVVMTQGIFSESLADVIRRAVVERGVNVYILVPPVVAQTPASYVPALSLLDEVQVRLIQHEEDFLIQDSTAAFTFELQPLEVNASELYNYFVKQWKGGKAYKFTAVQKRH